MRNLVTLLPAIALVGCATVPPSLCAPAASAEAAASELVRVGTSFPLKYQFKGTPGEYVRITAAPAQPNTRVLIQKNDSHWSPFFVVGDARNCAGELWAQAEVRLPPDDDGVYYVTVSMLSDPNPAIGFYRGATPDPAVVEAPVATAAATPGMAPAPRAAVARAAAPEPIYGNTGKYMCPFTEDGTVAPWVEKGMAASVGASVGGAAGSYAGQKALERVPFFGGLLGNKVGKATGREIAIRAAGGWEYIKASSDLSFNSLNDMARYLQATHAGHAQYAKVLQATYGIYPELQQSMLALTRR